MSIEADLILSEIKNLRSDRSEDRDLLVKTVTLLEKHSESFDAHCSKIDPMYQDYVFRVEARRRRKENWKSWSVRLGVVATVVTLVATFMALGK